MCAVGTTRKVNKGDILSLNCFPMIAGYYTALEHLKTGALVSLLDAHLPPNTAVWALYPQQRHLSPKVRKLVDYLKAGLAKREEYLVS